MEIILTDEGTPVMCTASGPEVFDFNGQYRGLYPSCRFTAAARCKSGYYLAGLDNTGRAHLFCSATGSTWVETVMTPQMHPELPAQCGKILSILDSPTDSHLYLVCENGYVITLPGCPKCVKESAYPEKFLSAAIHDSTLEIQCQGGGTVTVLLAALQQLRTSWSYALPALKAGALLIDLRGEDESRELPYAVHDSIQGALLRVKKLPKNTPLFLFCHSGTQADTVAEYARHLGHVNTFSLGGPEHLLAKNNGIWPEK